MYNYYWFCFFIIIKPVPANRSVNCSGWKNSAEKGGLGRAKWIKLCDVFLSVKIAKLEARENKYQLGKFFFGHFELIVLKISVLFRLWQTNPDNPWQNSGWNEGGGRALPLASESVEHEGR